ncbi:MAG TPA: polysaccharide deacetylase family protein [Albidovulum sp.]|uniref:polysaccharide deacetylase family protein n=1 Tax=Albidovulum sp. TaxID=1872424 RepID=UPI002CD6C278|nr:polysaccharide deacetylase family protein [Albidovulum sp.]
MRETVLKALDRRAAAGRPARLWWRDDDAVEPTAALDRMLGLARDWQVPLALAVIPEPTGTPLAERLQGEGLATVTVHGWAHKNHAPAGEKKAELGAHRPAPVVLGELARGLETLRGLHGSRPAPVLVPPWNRIAPEVVAGLPALGFRALSVFGPPKPAPLAVINTHVDLIDWHGTRGGRPVEALYADFARELDRPGDEPIGILGHHLVHDEQAWAFLADLFALTRDHPGCRWVGLGDLLPPANPSDSAIDR